MADYTQFKAQYGGSKNYSHVCLEITRHQSRRPLHNRIMGKRERIMSVRNEEQRQPLLVSLPVAFEMLGVRSTKGRNMIRDGLLPVVVLGTRKMVKTVDIQRIAEQGAPSASEVTETSDAR